MGNAKYKQKHRELGLCLYCSNKVYSSTLFCLSCIRKKNLRDRQYKRLNKTRLDKFYKERRATRKGANKCTTCGRPLDLEVDGQKITCLNCREGIHFKRVKYGTAIV